MTAKLPRTRQDRQKSTIGQWATGGSTIDKLTHLHTPNHKLNGAKLGIGKRTAKRDRIPPPHLTAVHTPADAQHPERSH